MMPPSERATLALAIDLAGPMVTMTADEIPTSDITALGRALQLLPESPRPDGPLLYSPWSGKVGISERDVRRQAPFIIERQNKGTDSHIYPTRRGFHGASGLRRLEHERATLVRALLFELARRVRLLGDPMLCRRFEIEIEGARAAVEVMTS